jgi:hypothetical protein
MKKLHMHKIIPFAVACMLAVSCTFKQEVNFNKNLSGTMVGQLDMTMMNSMGEEGSTEEKPSLIDEETKAKFEKLKGIKGITNFKYTESKEGIVDLSYDFDDLKSLNESGFLFYQDPAGATYNFFTLKNKKTLLFKMPDMSSTSEEDMGEMGSMFIYELTIRLPKNIKSLKTKGDAKLSDDKKSVLIATDLGKLSQPGYESEMEIVFK